MSILHKLQNLSEQKRKIILWLVLIIVGLGLLSLWVKNFQEKLKSFEMEEFKEELELPLLEEELKKLPKIQ